MQQTAIPTRNASDFALAYVNDAHNVGCIVRLVGDTALHRAHYAPDIQQHGVVIRPCHMVIVDRSRDPFEVVWRIGTVGTVDGASDGQVTVNLGYRTLTLPLNDARPPEEQAHAIQAGDRVLLRGRPIEQAAVVDTFQGAELAHPERLERYIQPAVERLNTSCPAQNS
jgi:hypothetical protein